MPEATKPDRVAERRDRPRVDDALEVGCEVAQQRQVVHRESDQELTDDGCRDLRVGQWAVRRPAPAPA